MKTASFHGQPDAVLNSGVTWRRAMSIVSLLSFRSKCRLKEAFPSGQSAGYVLLRLGIDLNIARGRDVGALVANEFFAIEGQQQVIAEGWLEINLSRTGDRRLKQGFPAGELAEKALCQPPLNFGLKLEVALHEIQGTRLDLDGGVFLERELDHL